MGHGLIRIERYAQSRPPLDRVDADIYFQPLATFRRKGTPVVLIRKRIAGGRGQCCVPRDQIPRDVERLLVERVRYTVLHQRC